MKRPGQALACLPLITVLSIGSGGLVPAVAQEQPANAPAAAATAPPTASGLSDKEKALLQKINALKAPRWRPFGACSYDWAAWKLMAGGVRTTTVQCGGATTAAGNLTESAATTNTASVAVHCDTLKLSIRSGDQAWSAWRLPYSVAESKERGGEDLMVVALCANAKPIPTTQPATPPAVPPATKPATKPAANPAQKPPTTKP
jgi:hypothetical protein